MDSRQHIDLLVLLIQQVLQILHLGFQRSHSLLERLRISSGKGATTEFVTGLALETDIGALGATWSNAVAANLLTSAAITGLRNTALRTIADLDHFHGENARHFD